MENLVFNIEKREEKGKKVRMQGEIPCIIYGESLDESIPCKITKREMLRLLSSSRNSVLSLNLGDTTERCVLKQVQQNCFGDIIHLDFQYVKKGDSIKLKVPVNISGQGLLESKGLLLDVSISEIQLQGQPDDIPEDLKIDVSNLEYGDSIKVKDLSIPENLKSDVTDDMTIARVSYLASMDDEIDEGEEEPTLSTETTQE